MILSTKKSKDFKVDIGLQVVIYTMIQLITISKCGVLSFYKIIALIAF